MRGHGMVLLMAVTALAPRGGEAQRPPATSGIHGSVVDAQTGDPLQGATVTLEVMPGGVLSDEAAGNPGPVVVTRRMGTGDDGRYRFSGLIPGSYRLRIVRIGYRSETLEVHYDAPADPRISVGLEVSPVELEALEAVGAATSGGPSGAAVAPEASTDRSARIRARQQAYHQADVRELTDDDVRDAMTLGEPDLLRTLQRLPGVVADDDWSAEPWTRGSRWDETRIYLDGLPLYDPIHGGGVFTSLSPDLVASMVFHPGVRPVESGAASGAVVEMNTKRALGDEHLSALAQISLLSGRLALERPLGERSGLAFSARRTYIDELAGGQADVEDHFPYRFSDYGGRWDQRLGERFHFTLSGARTEDRILGNLPHGVKGGRGEWGNGLLRGTLQMDRWGLRMRLTEGGARYRASIDEITFDPTRENLVDAAVASRTRNLIETDLTSFTVSPLARGGEPLPWNAGWERRQTLIAYDGAAARPFPGGAVRGSTRLELDHATDALWGAVRRRAGSDVELTLGARFERRDVRDEGATFLSPRIATSWAATPDLRVTAALGRHYQFEQAVSPTGFQAGPALAPTHVWLSHGGAVPAVRADLATLGAELWVGSGWLASASLYHRRSDGHVTPDPAAGFVEADPVLEGDALGAGWAVASGAATGIEVGLRRLAGRWTGSASYGLSRARYRVDDVTYSSPGDRTHALDASVLFRATPRTRLGATVSAVSGAPFTRFFPLDCPTDAGCPPEGAEDRPVIGLAEAAGAARGPAYVGLDLHVEREGRLFGLPFGMFLQVRNALARDNRSAYLGSSLACGSTLGACRTRDRFEAGMPRLPLLGFWLRM